MLFRSIFRKGFWSEKNYLTFFFGLLALAKGLKSKHKSIQ